MQRALKLIPVAAVVAAAVAGVAARASIGSHPAAAPADATVAAAYGATAPSSKIAADIRIGRQATAKYAMNLARAKKDGYRILTRMIPNMGYHFVNPSVKGFDIRKPPILVYEHRGNTWQLGAFEWTFTSKPAKPPLPGAQYGVFGAACHYDDGTFVFASSQSKCAPRSPQTGSAFNFWHPRLITLHLWLWYPNPSGLYMGTNPLAAPFNRG
ncbi:MAG: hypothetical protein ACXVR2_20440 [Solirubrobacteraceae bacterium]